MANSLKQMGKDTMWYGMSSIVGRLLNFLLVPLYTNVLKGTGEYGTITNLYAWVALLQVVLTFGMETTFFRYMNKTKEKHTQVYGHVLVSVGLVCFLFIVACYIFQPVLASFLKVPAGLESLVFMVALIVGLDAFTSIPYACLRWMKKPKYFAVTKFAMIGLNIALNLFFLIACPWLESRWPGIVSWCYSPNHLVRYIFISNLFTSIGAFVLLVPFMGGFKFYFDGKLLIKMLRYAFPILILGITGILNQFLDKILFPFMGLGNELDGAFARGASGDSTMDQLGVYGACCKVAVILTLFVQAFRYAFDPASFDDVDSLKTDRKKLIAKKKFFAKTMKYFVLFMFMAFLAVSFYLPVLQRLIGKTYRSGIGIVWVVMLGEIFFAIYYNLSVWYKITDKTYWGMRISAVGCAIILLINILFVREYSYRACAWAIPAGGFVMMLLSYFIGQRKENFPVQYPVLRLALYALLTGGLFWMGYFVKPFCSASLCHQFGDMHLPDMLFNTVLLAVFVAVVVRFDFPLKEMLGELSSSLSGLPVVGKFFKKKNQK